jgi:hypothetical protein
MSKHRNEVTYSAKRAARQRTPGASAGRRVKATQRAASAPRMPAQRSGSASRALRITPLIVIARRQHRRSAPQRGAGAGARPSRRPHGGARSAARSRLQARAHPAPALHAVARRPTRVEACRVANRAAADCAARRGDPVSRARVGAAQRRPALQRSRRLPRHHRSPSVRAEQRGAARLSRAALEARSMTARRLLAGCVLSVFRMAARGARRAARQQAPQPA